MSVGFENTSAALAARDMNDGAGMPVDMSPVQLLYSVVAHNTTDPENKIKLTHEQAKEIMSDFVDFVAGSSDTPTDADGRTITFNEMDDNQLMKCLSDYLGSGVSNTSINNATIEGAQELIAEQYMSEEELDDLPNPKTERGRALRQERLLEKMRDAAEEERSGLSKEDRDFLAGQNIDLGGVEASALDWTNALDKVLDNWDQSFSDMVDQGLAEPGEENKKKQEVLNLRKLMARDDLSKAEKQQLITQGLANGEYSQGAVTYVTQVMQNDKLKKEKKNEISDADIKIRDSSSSQTSAEVQSLKAEARFSSAQPADFSDRYVPPMRQEFGAKSTQTNEDLLKIAAANDAKYAQATNKIVVAQNTAEIAL